jgi:hypothetical protein
VPTRRRPAQVLPSGRVYDMSDALTVKETYLSLDGIVFPSNATTSLHGVRPALPPGRPA